MLQSIIRTCTLLALITLPCAPAWSESYPFRGRLAGTNIETRVDSPLVQTLFDTPNDGEVEIACPADEPVPGTGFLRSVTRKYSVDVATLVLIRCLERLPTIQQSQSLFLAELEALRRDGEDGNRALLDAMSRDFAILFVPGWGYRSNGDITGSDLRIPRGIISAAGFESQLVPVAESGSVEENAGILAAALEAHRDKKIIIVSASSAGPAVMEALGGRAGNSAGVAAWLNIGGVLRGVPVIDYFSNWPKSWLLRLAALVEGWQYDHIRSLSMEQSKPRFAAARLPAHITVVNYIGIPFSGDITPLAADFYPILKKLGPNDGLTLISDALAPGYTILSVGRDHFLREDPDIDLKSAALLPTLFKLMGYGPR